MSKFKSKSLVEMLCEKFNKEMPHLTFSKFEGNVSNVYEIDGENYTLESSVDVIRVDSVGNTTVVYIDHGNFKGVPAHFNMEDFIKIYETVVRISGKAIGLYQGNKDEITIVSPKISLRDSNSTTISTSLEGIAAALANEVDLLHCTLEEAWEGMSKKLTNKYNFIKVKEFIESK